MIYVEYYSTNRSLFYFKVWPVGKVVFPDFFKNSTKQIWKELIVKQHTETITFDGLWIVSNIVFVYFGRLNKSHSIQFQVYSVYKFYIYGTSSYNKHCNFTCDNFVLLNAITSTLILIKKKQTSRKTHSHMTRYKNNQITNNMTHSSIHFFTLIANITHTDWHTSTYTGLHIYTQH